MIPTWLVITICIFYLIILFLIAYFGDKRLSTKSIISNPIVYGLSLTTYCTAWTFFGSVGKASTSGISFLATYLGPILLCPLWVILFKKIIRITKREKISSISDFISTRYGKNRLLGNVITLMTFIFIIPYISIQLRAISLSFDIIITNTVTQSLNIKTTFFMVVIMAIFVILFGTRNASTSERNEGMVSVIAFEAIFKLLAFMAVGIFIVYYVFNGFGDIFQKANDIQLLDNLNNIQESLEGGYWDWFMLIVLSFLAFILLPRQFHLIAIENTDEKHVEKASWIFPLYLFLITLFVIPIAIAGKLYFAKQTLNPDNYVLYFPMEMNNNILATIVFLGGLSAATGMIIVETIAISTMLSKNILIPLIVKFPNLSSKRVQQSILFCRRLSIPIVLFAAYLYMIMVGERYPLVEIGLISFVGIVQLAPSFFGGLFWKKANYKGTMAGIIVGFSIWLYTLLLPTLIRSNFIGDISIIGQGPWGIGFLKPYALFGLEGLNKITHGFFWSILLNLFFYIVVSLTTLRKGIEIHQANLFIKPKIDFDHHLFRNKFENVYFNQLQELLIIFLGVDKARLIEINYEKRFNKKYETNDIVDIQFVDYAENILSDEIGNIAARIVISKLLKEEPLNRQEIVGLLEETKEAITHSKKLTIKSDELERTQQELMHTNEKLKEIDVMKNEFILTISHELRTPITSILLLSEMLYNEPNNYESQKTEFLETIVNESSRLADLIDDTLLQERLDLGKLSWSFQFYPINDLINNVLKSLNPIFLQEKIKVNFKSYSGEHFIRADKTHLERVFINVLTNAIKFKDPKKERNVIDIDIVIDNDYEDDKQWNVTIQDNGIGIHQMNLDKIFNTFVQVQNSKQSTKPKGSGLGLSISKKIIEKHLGHIKAKSALGKYTKIIITIPLYNSDEKK